MDEERKRRHELWIGMVTAFYAGRGESEKPKTKERYDEEKRVAEGGTPKEPTAEEWRRQEEAARFHDAIRENYYKIALSPYHFEDVMAFSNHVFEEPPSAPPPAAEVSEDARELEDVEATADMIAALENVVAASRVPPPKQEG